MSVKEAAAQHGSSRRTRITEDRSKNASVKPAGSNCMCAWMDYKSRLAYIELLAEEKTATSNWFLIRSAGWIGRPGLTISLVKTDNGSGYRVHLFLAACHSLETKSIKIKHYTPRTNGTVERFIQTSLIEWAYKHAYEFSTESGRLLSSLAS
jgi:hypothetical protein